jgi:hypothetical protein
VVLPLAALVLSGCSTAGPDVEQLRESSAQLTIAIARVTFQAVLQARYVRGQNNGGGAVIATATAAQAWETFSLVDINGRSKCSDLGTPRPVTFLRNRSCIASKQTRPRYCGSQAMSAHTG